MGRAGILTGNNEAVFLNSNGQQVATIPSDKVVTAVLYVEAGAEYEPVVFTEVSSAEEATFDSATGTTTQIVEVVDKVNFIVTATDTFNPEVDGAVVAAVATSYGKTLTHVPDIAAGDGWTTSDTERSYMEANDLVYVCSLPQLNDLPDGAYIAEISFDNTPSGDNIGVPVFYPNGVSATGAVASKVYMYTGSTQNPVEITANNAKVHVRQNTVAYLVFEVTGGTTTFTKPALVVKSTYNSDGVEINATNFPDDTFRSYVSGSFDINGDGVLSDSEIANVSRISVSSRDISSLQGVEYFTDLTSLHCGSNQLTILDVSNNTALTHLHCNGNKLTTLDVSNNAVLTHLVCGSNQLTELNVSNNAVLTYLSCGSNQLTELNLSKNTALTDLFCGNNQLATLDVSNNTALTYLDCSHNQLTALDVSNDAALHNLVCTNNQLTALDLSSNDALVMADYDT